MTSSSRRLTSTRSRWPGRPVGTSSRPRRAGGSSAGSTPSSRRTPPSSSSGCSSSTVAARPTRPSRTSAGASRSPPSRCRSTCRPGSWAPTTSRPRWSARWRRSAPRCGPLGWTPGSSRSSPRPGDRTCGCRWTWSRRSPGWSATTRSPRCCRSPRPGAGSPRATGSALGLAHVGRARLRGGAQQPVRVCRPCTTTSGWRPTTRDGSRSGWPTRCRTSSPSCGHRCSPHCCRCCAATSAAATATSACSSSGP